MLLFVILVLSIITVTILYVTISYNIWWSILFLFLAFIVWLIIYILIAGIIAFFTVKKNDVVIKQKRFFTLLTKITCRFLFLFYNLKIIIEGEEKLSNLDAGLFISNHQSILDPIVYLGTLKELNNLTFIMKDSVMNIPIIGRWLLAAGFLPIDRSHDRKALETIINSITKVKNGYSVGVFPEGTRSKGKNVNDFKDGTFKIAIKAKCPIIVAMVDNVYKVKKRFPFLRTKILVKICRVIPYEEIKDLKSFEISDMVRKTIMDSQKEARNKYEWLN